MKRIDLTGQCFGRLTAIEPADNDLRGQSRWRCRCDCGSEAIVYTYNLRNGNTKSCGCLNRENLLFGNVHRTHGECNTRLYRIWSNMIDRCCKKHKDRHPHYAGRGISVCEEWLKYTNFRDWALENGYRDDLSIDRKNVDGNYEPGNCRRATTFEQANNKRSNTFLTHDGRTMTVSQWADMTGISAATISMRITRYNWSVDRALTEPMRIQARRKKHAD